MRGKLQHLLLKSYLSLSVPMKETPAKFGAGKVKVKGRKVAKERISKNQK